MKKKLLKKFFYIICLIVVTLVLTCKAYLKLRNSNKSEIISIVKLNNKKDVENKYLNKILFVKTYEKLNNKKEITIENNGLIKPSKNIDITKLSKKEKNIIEILYLNNVKSLTEIEELYLNKNFEGDYQELIKDGILKEEINGIVVKNNKFSSNEYFFFIMSIIFWVNIIVRWCNDKKKIKDLLFFEEIIKNTKDYGELNEKIEELSEDSIIKKEWNNYISTFYIKDGVKYETIESDNFFNFEVLYKQQISYKVFNYMPQLLVGLGMLGTFFGLTTGLSRLDLSNVESIETGVGSLLSGVKTAFYTSLLGLSFSILLSSIINIYFSIIEKTIVNIRRIINNITKKSVKENYVEEIINYLNRIKVSNDDMANNLSSRIDNMSTELNKNISDYSNNVGVKIAEKIEVMANKISDNISTFSNSIGENFQEELSESLEKVFNKDLIGNINNSLGKVAEIFSENTIKMQEFNEKIKESTEKLIEVRDSCNGAIENTNNLKEKFEIVMNNINSNLEKVTENINNGLEKITEEVNNASDKYISVSTQLTGMLENLTEMQNNSIKILEENKDVMNVATNLLTNSKEMLSAEEKVQELWSSYEETFRKTNENFINNCNKYQITLSESSNIYKENLEITLAELRGILKQNSDEYNNFIKNQTIDYTNEIKKGLISLFTDYDKNLSIAVGSFNTALQNFNEKMDKFSEIIFETKELTENEINIIKAENELKEQEIKKIRDRMRNLEISLKEEDR